jgi:D-lactate dehydrogenase (cytochrome)
MQSTDLIETFTDKYIDYLHDESKLTSSSCCSVARPRTIEELAEVLRIHFAEKHQITVSGARTGIVGGAVPSENSHIVSLDRLKGIELLSDRKSVRVLGGSTLAELAEYLKEHTDEYYFPVDPTEWSASVGGAVATNASGARSYFYGSMRRWVKSVVVVLASGETLKISRGVDLISNSGLEIQTKIPLKKLKSSVGYVIDQELIDLFIGSEGTLGIIAEIELELAPIPKHRLYSIQGFSEIGNAFKYVDILRTDSSLQILALEFSDFRSLAYASKSAVSKLPRFSSLLEKKPQAVVYTECVYNSDEEFLELSEKLINIVDELQEDVELSIAGCEESDLREMKAFRHAVPEQINSVVAKRKETHPMIHKIATDMAVDNQHLAWVYRLYEERLIAEGLEFAIFGHIGNNHFHVNILPRDESELATAKRCYLDFASEIVKKNGVVSAEHGIGQLKKHFLPLQYSPQELSQLKAIKEHFDPFKLLNGSVLLSI